MYKPLWALINACWGREPWQFLFLTRSLCLASLASYLQKKITSLFQAFAFTSQHSNTYLWHVWPFERQLLILNLLFLKIMLHQYHLSIIQGNGKWINQANKCLLWEVNKLCRQNIDKEGSIYSSGNWKVKGSLGKQDLGQPGANTASQTLLAHVRQTPTSHFILSLQPGLFVLGQEELTTTPDQWSIHLEIISAFISLWLHRFFMTVTYLIWSPSPHCYRYS